MEGIKEFNIVCENSFEILVRPKQVTVDRFEINDNPVSSIFFQVSKLEIKEGIYYGELTDERFNLLKEIIEYLLIETSKKIAEGDISETNISILNYIMEFFKLCEELDYYSDCKKIVFYEERL